MSDERNTERAPPHQPTLNDVMDAVGHLASEVVLLRQEIAHWREEGATHCEVGSAIAAYRRSKANGERRPNGGP